MEAQFPDLPLAPPDACPARFSRLKQSIHGSCATADSHPQLQHGSDSSQNGDRSLGIKKTRVGHY